MSILAGATAPDAGEIALDGAPYRPRTPARRAPRRRGDGAPRAFALPAPDGRGEHRSRSQPARFGFVRRAEMRRRAVAALERVCGSRARRDRSPGRSASAICRPPGNSWWKSRAPSPWRTVACSSWTSPRAASAADDVGRLFSAIRTACPSGDRRRLHFAFPGRDSPHRRRLHRLARRQDGRDRGPRRRHAGRNRGDDGRPRRRATLSAFAPRTGAKSFWR